MTKYLLKRILRSLLSVILVVTIVMILIYSCLDRTLIFMTDPLFSKVKSNGKEVYMLQQWERYGYIDYIPYADYMKDLLKAGDIDQETYNASITIGKNKDGSSDSDATAEYVAKFYDKYDGKDGYRVERLPGDTKGNTKKYKDGGEPRLYAVRDVPIWNRLWTYLTGLIQIDNIHNAEEVTGERGITFTWYDPAYGGEVFSPAIIGNGTTHKYLMYCTNEFPFIHQNLITIQLGQSYTINKGIDVFDTMINAQGSFKLSEVTYPTGVVEETADDLHSATYVAGSLEGGTELLQRYYVDDYTNVSTKKEGMSRMGYSFVIGIFSVLMA